MSWEATKTVWVLVDLESEKKYTPPVPHFVRYSGNDCFAMFDHTLETDVLVAMHFKSYKAASKYLRENQNGMMSPKTTFPRELIIKMRIEWL